MLVETTPDPEIEELERLGEEIAELSAHLEVANARLLDLIREFDTRGGWGVQDARSCAHWLAWRLGIELHAARERVRVARALGGLPKLRDACPRRPVLRQGPCPHPRRDTGDGGAAARLRQGRHRRPH
jgi:hypothetical protein